jgi:hypothetical protein
MNIYGGSDFDLRFSAANLNEWNGVFNEGSAAIGV